MNQPTEAAAERPAAPYTPPQRPPQGVPSDPRQKSPFLAGLLSVMPGLGQVYVGYYQRGFIHAAVVATLITLLAVGENWAIVPAFAVFMAFFWLYNMIDAARRASLYNQALAGYGEIELPEDLRIPAFRGSILGGILVAAVGLVLLLNTRFGLSLDWIEEWWPAGLIAFGAYLVWRAWQDRPRPAARGADEVD